MNRNWFFFLTGLAAAAFSFRCAAGTPEPSKTERRPVAEEYHGIRVVEEYRWLEDASDPAVIQWTRQQNLYTRSVLDRLPARAALHRRLEQLHAAKGPSYSGLKPAGKLLFALKQQPPLEQSLLVALESTDQAASEKIVVDPNALNAKGTTSIEGFEPSPDGRLVAVALAEAGSEQGTLYLYETATGRALPDIIERVVFPTGGGSVAWERDGRAFYYTRYPRSGERPAEDLGFYEQVYRHQLGAPVSADAYVIGKEFPRIGEVFLEMRADGKYLLVTVQHGDGGDFAHWLRDPAGAWKQLTQFGDGVKAVAFGPDDDLYLFSKRDAPRGKILRMPASNAALAEAVVVVPEGDAVIEGYTWRGLEILPNFFPAQSALYVVDVLGGPSQIRIFDLDGQRPRTVPLLPVSAVDEVVVAGGNVILFANESFIEPSAWYRFDPARGETKRTALAQTPPVQFDDAEVVRELAVSKDGTRVPLNIIYRKGTKRDGRNPALLTGYGGYGVNITPAFLGIRGRIWLDQGGVFAVANLRGGGEFGEAWHKAGNLTHKQNVFDDFAACARHLIARRYTGASRLAIMGGSNGGLLMGATLTQHPELCAAVVSHVGIYDMLRVELEPNGAFNVPEFGTVKDPAQFRALYAYSPYHRVADGTRYPAVFMLTGENDGRVNPANSRKMTARLQAATGSKRPVLLRTSSSAGHGSGTALSERVAQEADVFAFLFEQVGIDYE